MVFVVVTAAVVIVSIFVNRISINCKNVDIFTGKRFTWKFLLDNVIGSPEKNEEESE